MVLLTAVFAGLPSLVEGNVTKGTVEPDPGIWCVAAVTSDGFWKFKGAASRGCLS